MGGSSGEGRRAGGGAVLHAGSRSIFTAVRVDVVITSHLYCLPGARFVWLQNSIPWIEPAVVPFQAQCLNNWTSDFATTVSVPRQITSCTRRN